MDTFAPFVDFLGTGLGHCRAVIEDQGALLGSLFIAGLAGGAGHCIAMCGPFVLAQSVARLEAVPAADMRQFHRLAGAALVPYHLGRLTTYVVLGALAAALAGSLMTAAELKWLSAVLLALAAALFLGYGIRRLASLLPGSSAGGEGWWSRHLGRRVRPLFERPVGVRGYGLGLALGFLPCGLLYGALTAAASSGTALGGAVAMGAFALGTVPALLVVGFAGHVIGRRWQPLMVRATPALMTLNAALLAFMAWRAAA
ncbi:MAG: sulfite exporter TauE/SafE family protein [Rhodospirillales bacterium]|nr:sulfite exporter TauE/SafE family protein [Rhodospirillales bacterium]